jgi:hypothetical protein
MDPARFDSLARSLSTPGSRRELVRRLAALPLAGALVMLLGRETTRADGSGAFGGGHRHRHAPARHHHHDRPEKDKQHKHRHHDKPKCSGLDQSCASFGEQCCPDLDPDVFCSGGQSSDLVCQDCTAPLDPNRALCQDPPGNQCCGGKPACFVAVPIETATHGPAVCLADVDCPVCSDVPSCVACTNDDFCKANARPGYTVCAESALIAPCDCFGNMCGKPC